MLDNKAKIEAIRAIIENDGWKFVKEIIDAEISKMGIKPYPSARPEDIAVEALARQKVIEIINNIIRNIELLEHKKSDTTMLNRMK